MLKEAAVGDAIFRPSSYGSDHLTLTWKMMDNIYRHFDIEEQGKVSDAKLGSKLLIKSEEFEDLDELLSRFIAPMNDFVDDVIHNKKFYDGSQDECAVQLRQLKMEHPKTIPYRLCFTAKHPGSICIMYISNTTAHKRYVEIRTQGFRFHGRI